MHPLNPYHDSPPNFAQLARKSSGGKVDGAAIDFQDGDSLRGLTEAILEHEFGLHVSLRKDRLCPPVPNRLDYLAWLQEIMAETRHASQCLLLSPNGSKPESAEDGERRAKRVKTSSDDECVRVLDVGTGAACIYPLLGNALYGWHFLATDVDAASIESARAVVEDPRNTGLSQARLTRGKKLDVRGGVHLMEREGKDPLLLNSADLRSLKVDKVSWSGQERAFLYHVVMCNPPFYSSSEEMQASQDLKEGVPSAVCQGSEGEMICEGGEVAFIARMMAESRGLSDQVIWFTSMIGKMASVGPVSEHLRTHSIDNFLFTELVQGKTKRWAVAWSHQPFRMASAPMVTPAPLLQRVQSASATRRLVRFSVQESWSEEGLMTSLLSRLDQLSIPWTRRHPTSIVVLAAKDTWSRKARRRAKDGSESIREDNDGVALCVQVDCHLAPRDLQNRSLQAGWLYGRSVALFEAFVMSVLRGWTESLGRA